MYRIIWSFLDYDRWKNFKMDWRGGGWSSLKLISQIIQNHYKFIVGHRSVWHPLFFHIADTNTNGLQSWTFSSGGSGGIPGTYHTKDKKTVCWELEAQKSSLPLAAMWDDLVPQFLLWNDRIYCLHGLNKESLTFCLRWHVQDGTTQWRRHMVLSRQLSVA